MPIYEYRCGKCGNEFEYLHTKAGDEEVACPECGGKKVEKMFSSFSVSTLPSFGGGSTCCGADSPDSAAGCSGPGSCCSKDS